MSEKKSRKDKTSKSKESSKHKTKSDKSKDRHKRERSKSKKQRDSKKRAFERPDPNSNIEDHYILSDKVLGRGYFAIVKTAVNKKTNERVAVKCIDKHKVELEKLWNEIDILEKAKHPRVVVMEAFFDTKDILYICMELMEGGEVYEEIVSRKQFTERDCSHIMKQVFEGLKYLHSINIIHRDLKLENLLIKDKSRTELEIKLADFGLSKIAKDQKTFSACGTPFYVAPDILRTGEPSGDGYSTEVDMWACGILMYILLSGRLPFHADSDVDLFKLILKGEFIFKSPQFDTVSSTAKDLISKLLVVNPSERLTAVQALEHPFISGEVKANPLHDSFIQNLSRVNLLSRARLDKAK
eukprot:TRINITY_DN3934_c0_g1_i3.p1 TRINITY_DN3934_c0_g1~~TRINITY_DN3934_c0_g1_i3.p1  ORF type:complete len:355 (-),score=48.33 TRINITY_DN3934_c0_g1_i3:55-1119(-)